MDLKKSVVKFFVHFGYYTGAAVLTAVIGSLTSPEFQASLKALVDGFAAHIPYVGALVVPALYGAVTSAIAAGIVALRNIQKHWDSEADQN